MEHEVRDEDMDGPYDIVTPEGNGERRKVWSFNDAGLVMR